LPASEGIDRICDPADIGLADMAPIVEGEPRNTALAQRGSSSDEVCLVPQIRPGGPHDAAQFALAIQPALDVEKVRLDACRRGLVETGLDDAGRFSQRR
jgi:hypothetical protein